MRVGGGAREGAASAIPRNGGQKQILYGASLTEQVDMLVRRDAGESLPD